MSYSQFVTVRDVSSSRQPIRNGYDRLELPVPLYAYHIQVPPPEPAKSRVGMLGCAIALQGAFIVAAIVVATYSLLSRGHCNADGHK